MTNNRKASQTSTARTAQNLSQSRKKHYLESLSEREFRDKVVRPVLTRMGLTFRRDLCGPGEEGVDCILTEVNSLNSTVLYAVQTKRGDISVGANPEKSLRSVLNQLEDALKTPIDMHAERRRVLPDKVLLVASGKLSKQARSRITTDIADPRLIIWDFYDIVVHIDDHYPEFWSHVDANRNPYLKSLQRILEATADGLDVFSTLNLEGSPISGEVFIPIRLFRYKSTVHKVRGEVHRSTEVDEISVFKILERRDNLVLITGPGGTGKSTALRKIAFDIAGEILFNDADKPIPVFMRARDLLQDTTLLQAGIESTRVVAGSQESAITPADAEAGKVLFLIDALDEVEESDRDHVIQLVLDCALSYNKCKIIVAARPYNAIVAHKDLRSVPQYKIASMQLKDANRLMQSILIRRGIAESKCQETLRRLQDVHGVELNPLIVTVYLATSDLSQKDVPPNITEIFSKYVELMLGRWDDAKGFRKQFQPRLKEHALSQLAYEMHRRNAIAVDVDSFHGMLRQLFVELGHHEEAETLSVELVDRSGLLLVTEHGVEFRHLMIQEYFAGRQLAVNDASKVANPWWRNAFVFACGTNPEQLPPVRELLRRAELREAYDRFNAAVTLGLATQACYLTPVRAKTEAIKCVVEHLAVALPAYVLTLKKRMPEKIDLIPFMHAYLDGRDAVGTDIIRDVNIDPEDSIADGLFDLDSLEVRTFWKAIGLIESEQLDAAAELLRTFNPTDRRLLLGVALSLFYMAGGRQVSKSVKKAAEELLDSIKPKVSDLTQQLSEEFATLLLDGGSGRIKAIKANSEEEV